tara:strand:- start:4036 stop:4566 length:531 start_codon:yes stop_codon:yes gene_type:complete
MIKQYTISIFTENQIGLLNRVSIIFTRRHINIESITASESEEDGIHRYTIVISEKEELVKKVVLQLEKQVDIVKAFYHKNEQVVFQEIALYKLPGDVFRNLHVEKIIRHHHARILAVEEEFTVLEKTGYKEETQELFEELKPFGLLEFVRSGRVAISKPMTKFNAYLKEVERASIQ